MGIVRSTFNMKVVQLPRGLVSEMSSGSSGGRFWPGKVREGVLTGPIGAAELGGVLIVVVAAGVAAGVA